MHNLVDIFSSCIMMGLLLLLLLIVDSGWNSYCTFLGETVFEVLWRAMVKYLIRKLLGLLGKSHFYMEFNNFFFLKLCLVLDIFVLSAAYVLFEWPCCISILLLESSLTINLLERGTQYTKTTVLLMRACQWKQSAFCELEVWDCQTFCA